MRNIKLPKMIMDFQLESSSNDEVADLFVWVEGDEDIPDDKLDECQAIAKKYIADNQEFYQDYEKVYLHFITDGGEEITMIPFYLYKGLLVVDEDYVYDVYDDGGDIVDGGEDYVCLDTAVGYAIESGGTTIKRTPYVEYEDGCREWNYENAEVVWKRDN